MLLSDEISNDELKWLDLNRKRTEEWMKLFYFKAIHEAYKDPRYLCKECPRRAQNQRPKKEQGFK